MFSVELDKVDDFFRQTRAIRRRARGKTLRTRHQNRIENELMCLDAGECFNVDDIFDESDRYAFCSSLLKDNTASLSAYFYPAELIN